MEPVDTGTNTTARQPPRWLALIFMGVGATVVAAAIGWLPVPMSAGVLRSVGAAVGLLFLLAGIAIALPQTPSRLHDFNGATLVTLFMTVAGWAAFAPGQRGASSSISVAGITVSAAGGEWLGRILWGFGAVLCGALAVFLWERFLFPPERRGRPTSPDR